MNIRAATLNDIEKILQLIKVNNQKSYTDNSERAFLIENLTENKSEIYIAIDDKTQEIMGFIQSYQGRSTVFRNSYHNINDIYVRDKYKEQTVETALLQYTQSIAIQFCDARIELQIPTDNLLKQQLFISNHYLKEDFFTYVKYIPESHDSITHQNAVIFCSDSKKLVQIRQASIHDLNGLLPLLKNYLEFYHIIFNENIDREFLVENLIENKSTIFIALENDIIIGFVQLYRNRCSEYKEDYYILYDLFVDPNQRKKGAGSLLLNAAEKFVQGQKLHYIELQTATDNKEAQRIYTKQGYQLKNITSFYKDLPINELKKVLYATQAQQQIWQDVQVTPKTLKYNMSWCWQITGNIKPELFENAWRQLVKSLPSLHTYFKFRYNKLFQIIDYQTIPQFEKETLSEAEEQHVLQYISTKTKYCFDLGKAPLCLAYIFISSKNMYFGMTFHHIVLDGHSIPLIMKYLSEFCQSNNKSGTSVQVIHKQLICKYIEQENKQLLVLEKSTTKQFWLDYLANVPRKINFHSEQYTQSQNQKRCINFTISNEQYAQMNTFAKTHHTTQFMIMSAFFAMLLYRYSQQSQFIIGYPFGRRPVGFENLIGYHVNLLPLKMTLTSHKSFLDLLNEIGTHREEIKRNGFDHYPYLEIVKNLKLFPLNNSALFNVILSPTCFGKLRLSGVNMSKLTLDSAENLTDLMLFYEANECGFEYNTKLFSEQTINLFIKEFEKLLRHFMQHPDQKLDQIPPFHLSQEQSFVAKV